MTPSVWSVLIIFVLAPIGVAVLVTAVVLLVASPVRRPMVVAPGEAPEPEGEGADPDGAADDNGDESGYESG